MQRNKKPATMYADRQPMCGVRDYSHAVTGKKKKKKAKKSPILGKQKRNLFFFLTKMIEVY